MEYENEILKEINGIERKMMNSNLDSFNKQSMMKLISDLRNFCVNQMNTSRLERN